MLKLLKAVRSEKGFTLIELLVVIGILAALAGVVTLAVTQFIGRGACEACQTEIHQCQTAAAAYSVEHHAGKSGYENVPTKCSDLVGKTLLTNMKYGDDWTIDENWVVQGDCSQHCGGGGE